MMMKRACLKRQHTLLKTQNLVIGNWRGRRDPSGVPDDREAVRARDHEGHCRPPR